MADDHIVNFRSRDSLHALAFKVQGRAVSSHHYFFCPYSVIKQLEDVEIPGKGKVFLHVDADIPKSYVEFRPAPDLRVDVYIDRKIWQGMKEGDPFARLVGAHELGHILLHKHGAMEFHGTAAEFAKAYGEEQSAEWQAIHFSLFVLISDSAILSRRSESEISIDCRVPFEDVLKRIELFEKMNKIAYQEWRSRSCEITL